MTIAAPDAPHGQARPASLALRPSLATIEPNVAFLDALAAWWLARPAASPVASAPSANAPAANAPAANTPVANAPAADTPPGDDPLHAADGIFLVPTRRAARSLAEAFLRVSQGRPLLAPRILALGGLDEAPLAMAGTLDIPPAVPPARRLAVLTRLVLAMNGTNGAPREADRAWVLAVELASLLDEAARAEVDLAQALPGAVGEAFASHWQVTLEFLSIVTQAWPAWLAEEGFTDVAVRQTRLLDAQTEAWRANPPLTPVIAAGTTGAIPAVSRLLRLVAHLPAGLVVLPGLDRALDQASWDALDASHPQASLRALLAGMQVRREDVRDWSDISGVTAAPVCSPSRIAMLRTALLPAASLSAWQSAPLAESDALARGAPASDGRADDGPASTCPASGGVASGDPANAGPESADRVGEGLQTLEPADQQEEAQAIALVLRMALEHPGTRAALVTPDRELARRVSAELLRFDVLADDSAGEPLAEVPAAVFLRLLAEAVAEDLRPVPLLALLKHPLCAAGLAPAECRAAARTLERECLRGPRPGPGIDGLRVRAKTGGFLDRLAACLRPLLTLVEQPDATPDRALVALLEAGEKLAGTHAASGPSRLWAGEDGEALAQHLSALHDALPILPPQHARTLPGLLDAILDGPTVRSRRSLRGRGGQEHPRIHIWGLLEARLQTADVIVLGGLTEGVWPQNAESGPWMNRPMRAAVGLPSPEERIGLSAHDFVMASCAAKLAVLSAPRRRASAPAVAARWLVRLEALLGADRKLARHPAAHWCRLLDRPDGPPVPVPPPAPAPAVALRPRRLSVTEIETWLRDPYAIYARHVLRLRRLDPLEQSADAADYGSIVHAGLGRFFARIGLGWPADAARQLTADMDAALDDAHMRPALAAWWRPRLRRIAAWAAEAEADRRAAGRPLVLCPEKSGEWIFAAPAGPFTLHGRADRLERRPDGSIAILDYKTGQAPTSKQVEEGRSPQLPLEAAMAEAGAFGPELTGPAAELVYWQISGGFEPGLNLPLFRGKADKIAEVSALARESLQALVASFDDAGRAYLSQPSPGAAPRFSDYARLARVSEWAAAEE